MATVRWKFRDVYQAGQSPWVYTWDINPNSGGTLHMEKNITHHENVGPHRGSIIQEGHNGPLSISFGGTILTQRQLEALEYWFQKKVLIELTDDLGRIFRGVLSSFTPRREYRPYNPYYHKYDAEFKVTAYRNASGTVVFGAFDGAIPAPPNLLTNPSFESDVISSGSSKAGVPIGWAERGSIIESSIWKSLYPNRSPQIFRASAASAGAQAWIRQRVKVERGARYYSSGWMYFDGGIIAPNNQGYALWMGLLDGTAEIQSPVEVRAATVSEETKTNRWIQLFAPEDRSDFIVVPENLSDPYIEIRLYVFRSDFTAEGARTLWDDIILREV